MTTIDDGAGASSHVLRGLAIAVLAAIASPCLADVIEIAPGGAVVTFASPAVYTRGAVEPIAGSPRPAAGLPQSGLTQVIDDAAVRNRVSAEVVTEVAWRESRFHQAAVSSRGAVGVMQLTAATARDLGVDRYDVTQNIHGGAAYLRRMMDRYGGDLRLALAAYNAGPTAVDRYRDVPPFQETQAYVAAILTRLSQRTAIAAAPAAFTR